MEYAKLGDTDIEVSKMRRNNRLGALKDESRNNRCL